MKRKSLQLVVAALAAGILMASLISGSHKAPIDVVLVGAEFLQSTQLDPKAVETLRRACGNCHSNQTQWPWYSRVAPVSWLLRGDVSEGRKFLNFSLWPKYGMEGQRQLLALAAMDLKHGSMPPRRYTAFHTEARLCGQERSDLIAAMQRESTRLLKAEQSNH